MNQKRANRLKKSKQFCDCCGKAHSKSATASFYRNGFEVCAQCFPIYGTSTIDTRNYIRSKLGNKTYFEQKGA